jgi:CheY-specific phosphatase CheX
MKQETAKQETANQETLVESYRDGMVHVTATVFETMLSTAVTVLDSPWNPPVPALTGAIFYAGLWKGALLVECSEQQARAWSSHIMAIPVPTDDDARDGLGELTNVLAGNFKPLLPHGVSISIPSVVAGSDYSLHVFRGHSVEQVVFADTHGPFRVTFARADEE